MATNADREVIREFLVSLGFQVETVDAKKFADVLLNTSKLAAKTGAAVIGVAAAAEATTQVFARSMEKLYYASQRTKSSVGSLQSLEYAFSQVGLTAEDAQGTIEAFASGLRLQPGLVAMLNGLGVKVEGRDRVQVLHDTVRALSKMPHYLGTQYAEQFGIPEHVFLHYVQNLQKIEEAEQRRREMNQKAKVDSEAAAKAAARYMQVLRELWEQVEVLTQKFATNFLPMFEAMNSIISHHLESLMQWVGDGFPVDTDQWGQWGEHLSGIATQLKSILEIMGNVGKMFADKSEANWFNTLWHIVKTQGGQILSFFLDLTEGALAVFGGNWGTAWKKLQSAGRSLVTGFNADKLFTNESKFGTGEVTPYPGAKPSGASAPSGDRGAFMAGLERAYGLPPGLLDRMWAKESNRGDPLHMRSSAGALGHFQFMPDTAKQYGLTNPNDFTQSAGAAARYMSDLLKKYNGNIQMALAAYNWGPGNVDRKGMALMPAETRDYVSTLAGGVTINPTTTITVHGTDPASTARAVAGAQTGVYSTMLRDTKGAIR